MIRKFLLLALAISTMAASARTLSPEEALSAALGTTGRLQRAPATRSFALQQTVNDRQGAPAVYLFSGAGDAFLVTPADDCVDLPVLGYGIQDVTAIPANMQAWLDEYARQIEWLRSLPQDLARRQVFRAPAETYAPVAPLCQTQWGQQEPYNNECPMVEGQRAVTGCVATAMAQIMKVHQWPERGTGTKTHTWEKKGVEYSDTFDYGNTTFDWGNMLDSYTGSYTDAQAKAVATLMHACGIASDMTYDWESSGTMEHNAGRGFIEHLRYNPAMKLEYSKWYTTSDWNDIIYKELAASRPVLYCGDSTDGGHAFVCDGYSSDGFFHINWGWTGKSDGYFLLTMLDPETQGTGGSSSAYTRNITGIIGIKPATSGETLIPVIGISGYFYLTSSSYTRNDMTEVTFLGNYNNYALGLMSYDFALGLKDADGKVTVLVPPGFENVSLDMMEAITEISLEASLFPVGNYDVFTMFRQNGTTEWQRMKGDIYDKLAYNFDVTEDLITVSNAKYEDALTPKYTIVIDKVTPEDPADLNQFIKGHSYNVSVGIMSSADADVNVATLLTRTGDTATDVLAKSDVSAVSLVKNSRKVVKQTITIPEDAERGKAMITIALTDADGNVTEMLMTKNIRIHDHFIETSAEFVSITPLDPNDGEHIYAGHSYNVTVNVTSTGAEDYECMFGIIPEFELKVLAEAGPFSLSFTEGGVKPITGTLNLKDDYTGNASLMFLNTTTDQSIEKNIYIEKDSGIDNITADTDAPAQYFNLQGLPVANPTPGALLIRRQGSKAEKVLIR